MVRFKRRQAPQTVLPPPSFTGRLAFQRATTPSDGASPSTMSASFGLPSSTSSLSSSSAASRGLELPVEALLLLLAAAGGLLLVELAVARSRRRALP